jgi:hypothetical protein
MEDGEAVLLPSLLLRADGLLLQLRKPPTAARTLARCTEFRHFQFPLMLLSSKTMLQTKAQKPKNEQEP